MSALLLIILILAAVRLAAVASASNDELLVRVGNQALYLLLQIFCSMCYNPTGIIGETTDGITRMKKNEPPSVWGSLALVGQLGFVIAIPIALGAIGGRYLDGIVHTNDIFLLLGLLLGLVSGIYGAYRLLAPFLKR